MIIMRHQCALQNIKNNDSAELIDNLMWLISSLKEQFINYVSKSWLK